MKKLILKKDVIARLSNNEANQLKGGSDYVCQSAGTMCHTCRPCLSNDVATICQKSCVVKCDGEQPKLTIEIYDCQSQACPTNPVSRLVVCNE